MEDDKQIPFFDAIVCASGSGGTHAGIAAGFYESEMDVIGISTRQPKDFQTDHIHSLAEKTYRFILDDPSAVLPKEQVLVHDEYVGPGYSLPTEGMEEAVTLFARLEGILLDPVYTGKTAAGMIDLVRQGRFRDGSNVIFLHTGGAPSLYHYLPISSNVAGIAGAGQKKTAEADDAAEEKKSN